MIDTDTYLIGTEATATPDPPPPELPRTPPQEPPPPPPPPLAAPSFFELEEVDACAEPHGVGVTAVTGMFTLEVTYQLLLNNQQLLGSGTLNGVGASVFESVTVTSGQPIGGNGQWCPAGSTFCAKPGTMNPYGQFTDDLAANPFGPSTANQVFSLYEAGGVYTLPVINFPGSPTVLRNTYSKTGVSVASGAVVGNSSTRLCPPRPGISKHPIYHRW